MATFFGKLAFAYIGAAMGIAAAALPTTVEAKAPAPEVDAPYCQALQRKGCDVDLSSLPVEARKMDSLIREGGPFKYDKDGTVFGNREGLLPRERRGFYREYTVRTPGARNRGARRIVCRGREPSTPVACYYSDDHYASFRRIVNAQ